MATKSAFPPRLSSNLSRPNERQTLSKSQREKERKGDKISFQYPVQSAAFIAERLEINKTLEKQINIFVRGTNSDLDFHIQTILYRHRGYDGKQREIGRFLTAGHFLITQKLETEKCVDDKSKLMREFFRSDNVRWKTKFSKDSLPLISDIDGASKFHSRSEKPYAPHMFRHGSPRPL